MSIVTEYDWETNTWTHHHGDTPTKAAWRAAVADIATKAKAKLPECIGRVDSAVKIGPPGANAGKFTVSAPDSSSLP
jgi:hypothetical protein